MKSNYKKLGEYIQQVNIRNTELKAETLLGVSIKKILMPSIANTVGTNMKTYKIIKRNQFAYGPVTSRNGDKISVALLEDYDEAIVSQAYTVFEVVDPNKLNPEYLMMWMRRPEFDRYARFKSHGSAREVFDWDEMCEVELPIPSIEKQQEIVREYNVIIDRIKLNEKLNHNLEETAKALYKHWFVDFEFPNYEGKPYKSSGGEMIYNEALETELPIGWECLFVSDIVKTNYSNYSKIDVFEKIEYLDTSSITNNKIAEIQNLVIGVDAIPSRAKRKVQHGDIVFSTVRPNLKHFGIIKNPSPYLLVSTGFVVIQSIVKEICSELIFQHITSKVILEYFQSKAEMSVSTYPSIKPEDILNICIPLPMNKGSSVLKKISIALEPVYELQWKKNRESDQLEKLKKLILSKMTKLEMEN